MVYSLIELHVFYLTKVFSGDFIAILFDFQLHQMPLTPLGRDLYPIGLHFEAHHHPENLNLPNI
jgi:hypothetical protein